MRLMKSRIRLLRQLAEKLPVLAPPLPEGWEKLSALEYQSRRAAYWNRPHLARFELTPTGRRTLKEVESDE